MHLAVPAPIFPASGTTSHMGLLSNLLLSEVEGKVYLLSSQVSPPPRVCTAIKGNVKVGILKTQWRLVLTIYVHIYLLLVICLVLNTVALKACHKGFKSESVSGIDWQVIEVWKLLKF